MLWFMRVSEFRQITKLLPSKSIGQEPFPAPLSLVAVYLGGLLVGVEGDEVRLKKVFGRSPANHLFVLAVHIVR